MIRIRFDGRSLDELPLSPAHRTPVFDADATASDTSARYAASTMNRRRFLTTLGMTVLGLAAGAGAFAGGEAFARGMGPDGTAALGPRVLDRPRPAPRPSEAAFPMPKLFSPPGLVRVALPHATLTALPGQGNLLALTVDDGADPDVVGAYAEFAARTGMRFTFFVTARFDSWRIHADAIRAQVEAGRIQLGNHTWSHPALTKLPEDAIRRELDRTGDFIRQSYGVEARPYFRPPYGFHDARVDAAAAASGWTQPVLWYGSLSDSGLITEAQVMQFARQWFLPQHVVIGHANFPPVTQVFDRLAQLIAERRLRPVTLDDVFLR
jgi:peptidoglycan/xylan/chitin deacetylase (PgdA/CDA1 family)